MIDPQGSMWAEFIRGCISGIEEVLLFDRLHGDASARTFYRVSGTPDPCVLIVHPDPPRHDGRDVDENDTWVYMARLLRQVGGDPPQVHGYDREQGLILCEDVGDEHLQGEVQRREAGCSWTRETYRRLLELLAVIQAEGARRFDPEKTFNPTYDADFMFESEALYFAEHFVHRLCGVDHAPLHTELRLLAETAAETVGERLMIYRDFQSRNVFVQQPGDRLRLLDFQGARPGPAAYDVASLLFDPYLPLKNDLREELAGIYPELLSRLAPGAAAAFEASYRPIAAHRLMQVLGAYAKLALVDGKRRFLIYIPQALDDLREVLADPWFDRFGELRKTVDDLEPHLTSIR